MKGWDEGAYKAGAQLVHALASRGICCVLVNDHSDAPFVQVVGGSTQVVTVSGWDVWRNGQPVRFDASFEEAISLLEDEAKSLLIG